MATFTPEYLLEVLRRLLPASASRVCVAFSGGLDSTVLLSAVASIRDRLGKEIRALHIDHGLHPASTEWAKRCERTAAAVAIPLVPVRVNVDATSQGVEAAARAARYEAFRSEMHEGEALLTAHHADDQLETVLLALMRGAGPRGLSASPPIQPFGRGWLVRPLLEFRRCELERWSVEQRLEWITDPSNDNTSMDRNFLRHEIVPKLKSRWPAAAQSAVRSALHLQESAQLLEALAEIDLQTVQIARCLRIAGLRELSGPRRRNVLRHWLRSFDVRAPSARRLAAIEHDMLVAQHDRVPSAKVDGAYIRRHRDLLYCVPALRPMPDTDLAWPIERPLALPTGLGTLRLVPTDGEGIAAALVPQILRVRFRRGGESLKAIGDVHRRSLKKRLQEAHVLPWWRGRMPIVYAGERLVAVGDLWINAEFAARGSEPRLALQWNDKPAIHACHGDVTGA